MVSSEAVMKKLEIGYSSNLRKNLLLKFAKTRRNFWANHSHFPKLRFTCLFPAELPCIMIPDHDIISDFRYLTPKDLGFLFSTIYIDMPLDFHPFHTCFQSFRVSWTFLKLTSATPASFKQQFSLWSCAVMMQNECCEFEFTKNETGYTNLR